jgi:hypothetical protein
MKTCVLFNIINHRQENEAKIKLKHQNLTSQILTVFTSKSGFYRKIQTFGGKNSIGYKLY